MQCIERMIRCIKLIEELKNYWRVAKDKKKEECIYFLKTY